MRPMVRASMAAASVAAAVSVTRRLRSNGAAQEDRPGRWLVVTVNRPPEEVGLDGRPPDPLAALGDEVEVRVQPAPGGRGSELAARLRAPEPTGPAGALARVRGNDPRQRLRVALRDSKQLLETGEVLQPDRPPTTERTLRSLPLVLAMRRAKSEGRL